MTRVPLSEILKHPAPDVPVAPDVPAKSTLPIREHGTSFYRIDASTLSTFSGTILNNTLDCDSLNKAISVRKSISQSTVIPNSFVQEVNNANAKPPCERSCAETTFPERIIYSNVCCKVSSFSKSSSGGIPEISPICIC